MGLWFETLNGANAIIPYGFVITFDVLTIVIFAMAKLGPWNNPSERDIEQGHPGVSQRTGLKERSTGIYHRGTAPESDRPRRSASLPAIREMQQVRPVIPPPNREMQRVRPVIPPANREIQQVRPVIPQPNHEMQRVPLPRLSIPHPDQYPPQESPSQEDVEREVLLPRGDTGQEPLKRLGRQGLARDEASTEVALSAGGDSVGDEEAELFYKGRVATDHGKEVRRAGRRDSRVGRTRVDGEQSSTVRSVPGNIEAPRPIVPAGYLLNWEDWQQRRPTTHDIHPSERLHAAEQPSPESANLDEFRTPSNNPPPIRIAVGENVI